jgi:hypothetical protein
LTKVDKLRIHKSTYSLSPTAKMGKAQSSVEVGTVRHENASAHDESSQRSPLLLSCSLVGGVLHAAASAYTNARGTALSPLAFRGTRRSVRGRPSGSRGAAKRLLGRSCPRNTSRSRGAGRTMRQGRGGKRLGGPKKRAEAVGVVLLDSRR